MNMMRKLHVTSMALLLTATASAQFAQSEPAYCAEGQLYIRENDLRGDLHITGFSYDLERGTFLGIARFPEAWDMTVQHLPSGPIRVEAHARSNSDSINGRLFQDIAVYVHDVCDEQKRLAVHGKITVIDQSGSSRDLPFSAFSFKLDAAPIRRRLSVR